ncbi:class I SAM-dependent DNA methyltransferase [Corynebacterium sp. 320]|uniref:DNA methyltransferase n=1 Tax=Corynebacterium TaxID=1716 RepID=UPI00125CC154|nr:MULTISPECIES: DNA methyltransferase [Corynebacterium]KAB1503862.1 class I SAM-dependent DNA methyltransferase [Corynebacterium sp. 320]KAB3527998.1 class I SAM-dependent DNA methyltransferase [Corynebacterium sp. 250]QNP91539.1 class I SAM-dependent DNA methyltransferase [Corynebacterium zhongnanshanii]
MADFDSIINVEEWISDYYLTTDEKGSSFGKRVDNARKDWSAHDKRSNSAPSPLARLSSRREELQTVLSSLEEEAAEETLHKVYDLVSEAFGYPPLRRVELARNGQPLSFNAATDAAGSVVILRAGQLAALEDTTTVAPLGVAPQLAEKPLDITTYKLVGEIFLAEQAPDMIVILAGTWVMLAERETWPLGRYLAVDLGLAIERNDQRAKGELPRVIAILANEHVTRGADGTTWWLDTLAEARDHSVKVSEELRGAIKASIEIIGNDVLQRRRHQAHNLTTPPDINGNELANQALRYLYRILFLLFAESSPELQILPTGDSDYDAGYGLSRLRELILTEPTTHRAQNGTHLYESLQLLFDRVNRGHDPRSEDAPAFDATATEEGLEFRNLDADLFKSEATSYIDEVKLSNLALHKVLQNLLLTKEKRGSDRGFISYATLGVTELGQVYEGLMSYTGYIAQEDLVEVAKHGDPSKGSWVVPEAHAQTLPQDSIVYEDRENEHGGVERAMRTHARGSFVYRQSSRDRERSASFYTPPVITEFTVGQAIEELEATGRIERADDILTLAICEPAMGSGAFAVEAVNQLSELYLTKKQQETKAELPSENRAQELQKVKAHIALHQVYGVDLNKTAVELAEISLWLSTMTKELKAPWFGLHLRHGNSLVGATRSTFGTKDVTTKAYLKNTPQHHSVKDIAAAIDAHESDLKPAGRVHHFLVPSQGWGAAAEAKDLKDIAAEDIKAMKAWRSSIRKGLTKTQAKLASRLSAQVEKLWELALIRQRIAEDQVRRDLDLWGQPEGTMKRTAVVTRDQVEQELLKNNEGAYLRLRTAMNAWNALWYWPVTGTDELPDIDEYLATMEDLLGTPHEEKRRRSFNPDQFAFGFDMTWEELDYVESLDRSTSGRKDFDEVLGAHPWLVTANTIAEEQAFFHWDLDFAVVMAQGGFDFQVGNPPWVRPRTDVDALLSEHDPWFSLANKPTQAEKKARRELLAADGAVAETLSKGLAEAVVTSAVLGDVTRYPHLRNQQPDLYRAFMERTWSTMAADGVVSLIHPESHFTEKKAAPLRAGAYRRLRRHWQFINELVLFDVHDLVKYGIHVYAGAKERPNFISASALYHPKTVIDSLVHDGTGSLPGFKDDNDKWDVRPHRDRIITVDEDTLQVWNSIIEDPGTPLLETRTVYSVNSEAAAVLAKLAEAPRIKSLGLQFSGGWHETADKKRGYFDTSWQHPESWEDVILQGPHLGVATPMIKQPNPTMKHNQDWFEIDLEAMPEDFIPATAYRPNKSIATYGDDYGYWSSGDESFPIRSHYRVAWRQMAALTGYRTLYPALIPPGSAHVNGVISAGIPGVTQSELIPLFGGYSSSILADFLMRSIGSHLWPSIVENGPLVADGLFVEDISKRFLQLNVLTENYASLWEEVVGTPWTRDVALRNARERWHAQNEIDAMVALSLGVTLEELLMIYRTQFPVMRRYDQEDLYDVNGRKVAGDVAKLQKKLKDGEELSLAERTWTHPQSGVAYVFEYPFAPLDREADLTAAYEKYAAMMDQ